MTLIELKSGQTGKVTKVAGAGPIRRRLIEMGIHAGEKIKMIKSAPLKDPLEISTGNGHISIRRSEAVLINIRLIS
jgi:Fe2+ transport system protein FeoA